MPRDFKEVVEQCQSMIQVGSKSFSMAAHLFGKEKRDGAFLLYGWCRLCDDEIDGDAENRTKEQMMERLTWLKAQTELALQGKPIHHPVFYGFSKLVEKYEIPRHYPMELLEGMAMDIEKTTYDNLDEVLLYSYRVASTVGLMMSHIMGVSDPRALSHAAHLGLAMQLTNISRDVEEDVEKGRVYLPSDWLAEEGVKPEQVGLAEYRGRVFNVVDRLLDVADNYYRSGDQGLQYLSLRSAATIAVARHIYSDIGNQVRSKGAEAWAQRAYTTKGRKLVLLVKGVFHALKELPKRILGRWRPIRLESPWIWPTKRIGEAL